MGLFDFFKTKPKPTFETDFGIFTLISPKHGIWQIKKEEISYSVKGNQEKPDAFQVEFLKNILSEVEKLDEKIQREFMSLHKEVDFTLYYSDWRKNYEITAFDIWIINENFTAWEITFSNKDENDFAHYSLLIENEETKGFSIST